MKYNGIDYAVWFWFWIDIMTYVRGFGFMKDVERIDNMIEFYFREFNDCSLEKDRLSCSKMLVDLMNLKFKYLGVEKEEVVSGVNEIEVRRRLKAAGLYLGAASPDKRVSDDC